MLEVTIVFATLHCLMVEDFHGPCKVSVSANPKC